jgi:hypothetical protein
MNDTLDELGRVQSKLAEAERLLRFMDERAVAAGGRPVSEVARELMAVRDGERGLRE